MYEFFRCKTVTFPSFLNILQLRNSYRDRNSFPVRRISGWCRTQYFFTKQTGENNTHSPDERGRGRRQRDERQCDEGDRWTTMTPARVVDGAIATRATTPAVLSGREGGGGWRASVSGCGVAGAGGQAAAGFKREVTINMFLGGVVTPLKRTRVVLKRQFTAFYSLVVCEFFRQTETS